MKKILLFAAIIAALVSCRPAANTPDDPTTDPNTPTKAFTFHIKGDFSVAQEDMSRAPVRLENDNTAGITDLWVMDYVGGTLVQQVHQTTTDTDFGHPQMNLTYGEHSIQFIASKGTEPNLTASGITWAKVHDTFCLDYPVTVSASSNGNRAPELKRCISGVTIENTDAIPTNAKEMQVTIVERYSTLTLPGLVGSNAQSYTNTFPYTAADAGTKNLKLTTYTLCPQDEFTVDVTVRVIATDNSVISEFTVPDVALKVNRKSVLKGECFDRSNGFQVMLDAAWDEPSNIFF